MTLFVGWIKGNHNAHPSNLTQMHNALYISVSSPGLGIDLECVMKKYDDTDVKY